MTKTCILILFLSVSSIIFSQDLPLGYIVHFQEEFSKSSYSKNIILSADTIGNTESGWFYLSDKNDAAGLAFPGSTLLIDNHVFGEYIASLKINPKNNPEDTASAFYIILGLRDSSNYYFVEMNAKCSRFGSVYKGQRTILQTDSGLYCENNKPITLRITRDILNRSITIQKNGNTISFTDPNLVMGYFGIGVENGVLAIDSFIIWAPTSIAKPAPVFKGINQN
ncbi:MAG: hypothetical protein JXA77_07935 [Bacteroidales bacterium]|nr:hypothetical protein [Bacteroidales bacterium]MBN2817744.1 hypothetical protein [Bacteroidales bacterium]